MTPILAEIIGLLCAEGCLIDKRYNNHKQFRIEFYSKCLKLREHFLFLLQEEFNYNPKPVQSGKINICRRDIIRCICSHTMLGHLSWSVPLLKTKEEKVAFVRGYFDGDGTAYGPIRFFSTNKKGLQEVKMLLDYLEYTTTIQKPVLKKGKKPLFTLQLTRSQKKRFLSEIKSVSKDQTAGIDI